jgi:DNA transposition AAA+ family ATPase
MTEKGIQKGLEQDAQLIKERIPMDLTKNKAAEIAASLRQFMVQRDYSQSRIAKMVGVSPPVINQFLSGKYEGDVETLVNKIVNLINSLSSRDRHIRGTKFISTTVARKIETLIENTDAFSSDEGKCGIITGDGGHGKTVCLKEYAKANKNTIYVQIDQAMHATRMFAEIAEELGLDSSGGLDSIARRLIANLQNRHVTVILDEASSLNVKQLDLLRQIIMVKCRCPLILAGNADLLKTVMQPTTRKGFESLDQFTSRLMQVLDLNAAASDKDGGLYSPDDIRKLFEYGGIKLATDAVSTLRRICKTPRTGRLRTCTHVISALHTAKPILEAEEIDAEDILAAIQQLNLQVRVWLPVTTTDRNDETETQTGAKVA